jgi:hypothetical protein
MKHWQIHDGDSTQLVMVGDESVFAQSGPRERIDGLAKLLESGQSPGRVFGPDAQHVVLRDTRRVQQNSSDHDIDFIQGEGKEEKTISVSIADSGMRDDIFGAVERVTEGRLRRYDDSLSRPRAALPALTALTVFGFGTVIAVRAAAALQAADEVVVSGRKKGLKQLVVWVLETLGPTGVAVIGGLICALCLWTLQRRLRTPPHLQLLQSTPYRSPGPLTTGLKYLALIAVWMLFAPGLLR